MEKRGMTRDTRTTVGVCTSKIRVSVPVGSRNKPENCSTTHGSTGVLVKLVSYTAVSCAVVKSVPTHRSAVSIYLLCAVETKSTRP